MSFWAVDHVRRLLKSKEIKLTSSESFVLRVLANFANTKNIAFPSRLTIVNETNLNLKTVQKALLSLREKGLIRLMHYKIGKTKRVNVHELICVPRHPELVVDNSDKNTSKKSKGFAKNPNRPSSSTHNSQLKKKENNNIGHSQNDRDIPSPLEEKDLVDYSVENEYQDSKPEKTPFQRFWEIWPKKVKKKEAEALFRFRQYTNEEVSIMIRDIETRMLSDWRDRDKQFIPNPDTYLSGERWNDENLIIRKQDVEENQKDAKYKPGYNNNKANCNLYLHYEEEEDMTPEIIAENIAKQAFKEEDLKIIASSINLFKYKNEFHHMSMFEMNEEKMLEAKKLVEAYNKIYKKALEEQTGRRERDCKKRGSEELKKIKEMLGM